MISQIDLNLRATQPATEYAGGVSSLTSVSRTLTSGTGSGSADLHYYDTRTLAATTSEDLDLRALTDAYGAALSLVEVVAIAVSAPTTNAGVIEVKPSASNGWTGLLKDVSDVLQVRPGATVIVFCPSDGQYVTTSSNKSINVNNTGGTSGSYTLHLIGRSA